MKNAIHIAMILFVISAVGSISHAADTSAMLVQSDWLVAHQSDPGLVILHVGVNRTAYDAGHITGAQFLSWGDITVGRDGVPNQLPPVDALKSTLERVGVGDKSRVVIYGDTPLLASFLYFELDYLGHGNHSILDGGLEKWRAEKHGVSTDKPAAVTAKLTPVVHPELLVDMAAVQKIATEKKMPVIDGRAPEQYSGATPGDGIKRGGHIPGAKNLFWMQALISKDNPVLKPVADIRAMYTAAGAKPDGDLVVYCRTGPIATHEYFTAKLAGFRPVLYNGSFMEWSNATGTAIETGSGGQP